MNNSSKGLQHLNNLRKNIFIKILEFFKPKNKFVENYDKFLYIVVFVAPLSNVPQIMKIYLEKDAGGVSAISWFSFALISVSWLIYGILHKDKHITIMNSLLIIVQSIIGIGAIIYS